MKRLLAAIALLFAIALPTAAYAGCDSMSVSGLPESAIIDLKKKCVEIQTVAPAVNVNSMSEYAELGKKYGLALSEVAKSVGTTVNDLAQTPVGKFMLVMVAWKVMGEDLIGIVGGFLWFIIMLPLWTYMFHRLVLKNRTYREYVESYLKDDKPKVVRREYDALKYDNSVGAMAFFMGIALTMICIAGFVMVFA